MMRRLTLAVLLVLLASPAWAAITFFNDTCTPADAGDNSAEPVVITPPSSMVAGDLAVVIPYSSTATLTHAIVETGGQSWTTTSQDITGDSMRMFWARFNGTWSANPSFDHDGTGAPYTACMKVFRPTAGANTWLMDVDIAYTNPAASTTYTITGMTRPTAGAVAIAVFASEAGQSTWGTLTGSGWSQTGLDANGYINTNGVDMSIAYAYNIGSGSPPDVSLTQSVSLAGKTAVIVFAEVAAETAGRWWGGGWR